MSPTISSFPILLTMAITLFVLGAGAFITGVLILALRAGSRELNTLSNQTSTLAQKGLAEDIAQLVGSATQFMDAANQLVRTVAGVGVFLTLLGLLLMGSAAWFAMQSLQMLP